MFSLEIAATSDGSQASVDSRSGGNCVNKNMKLRIFVCKDAQGKKPNGSLKLQTIISFKTPLMQMEMLYRPQLFKG